MHIPFNDLRAHHEKLQPQLNEAIAATIRDSAFIRGPQVDAFEREFAAKVGVKHCLSCANGTDAIYIAMKALKVGAGDEVITTAHSWIATSETITQTGAKVVFCDTDSTTYTIDPADIRRKLTPRTKGIIPVHLYGQSADMAAIMEIARENNLWVIEDCAQAHLATFDGKQIGTFGDAATFSFYPGKNLGAMGDAGALVTSRAEIYEWTALYARHGGKGDHLIEGINSRMDGIHGAVLRVKLPHLEGWTARRQQIAGRYNAALNGVGDIQTPIVAQNRTHVYHLFVIQTEKRDALKEHLKSNGVETVLNYPRALPFYPAYKYLGHKPEDFPNAYRNQSRILSLPIYPEMTSEQVDYVADCIRRFFA